MYDDIIYLHSYYMYYISYIYIVPIYNICTYIHVMYLCIIRKRHICFCCIRIYYIRTYMFLCCMSIYKTCYIYYILYFIPIYQSITIYTYIIYTYNYMYLYWYVYILYVPTNKLYLPVIAYGNLIKKRLLHKKRR